MIASDVTAGSWFGCSVALSGNTALVGAQFADNGLGAAYIFTDGGTTWTQRAQLTASDGAVADIFGQSVALSGSTALVGAPMAKIGANGAQGAAYFYEEVLPFVTYLPAIAKNSP